MTARGRREAGQDGGDFIVSLAPGLQTIVCMPLIIDRQLSFDSSTDYAHEAGSHNVSALTLLFLWLHGMYRRVICLLTGHKTVLHFEPRRMALRCTDCGYETPGWTIGEFTPSRVIAGIPSKKLVASNRAA